MRSVEDKYYTEEEYLSLVEELDYKIEYLAGEVYALAGSTSNHSIIVNNIRRRIAEQLDDKDCVVYDSDMQLFIETANAYVYPDAMIVCGERDFTDDKKTQIKNPVVVIEVLSESTQQYDKTKKFRLYRSIPSFKEYLLIDPKRVAIDGYYKESSQLWRISSATGLSDVIDIHALGISLKLSDIYAKTQDLEAT